MHALDSRSLGPLNCYIQKITSPDELTLEVRKAAAGYIPLDMERAQKAKVKKLLATRQEGTQHQVAITFKGNDFIADISKLDLREGDAILFHQPDRKRPGFAVRGTMGKTEFDSCFLKDQAVYTHAFGLPGRYEWTDANGSGVGGVVTVVNDPAEGRKGAERAMKRLSEGVVVHIVGTKVKPAEVTITTGQTVFFAVEDTKGITITDVSLL